jgi:N-acetylmuramate 1-kinase
LGIVMLEDLGDVTLQAHLSHADARERQRLYDEAIDIIATLQRRGRDLASHAYPPYQLAFDVEKLTWELAFFVTHFIEGHRGGSLSPGARAALDSAFLDLCRELAAEPQVLCHRDYHSRNLMVRNDQLVVIDFQDARMGPDTYDLASLLCDTYVTFTREQVEVGIERFLAVTGTSGSARGAFRRRFDVMTVQRTLKALGTFGFQATARQNTSYLVNVPRAVATVRGIFGAYPRFATLQRLLADVIPELG